MEYLLASLDECDLLHIGITQYLHDRLIRVDSLDAAHRTLPAHNPLSYFERMQMIEIALRAEGISQDRFDILPFPIEEIPLLAQFLPTSVPIFTTTYDSWNEEKIRLLRSGGYDVIVLWERQTKEFEGHQLRSDMLAGNPRWKAQVPTVVAEYLEELGMPERLRALSLPAGE
ncbi:MAG: hypothetical protein JSR24_15640 [Proteobacteria bacterium]|nr:hypothetical protein [Pseudomonadota bacterium]